MRHINFQPPTSNFQREPLEREWWKALDVADASDLYPVLSVLSPWPLRVGR